MLMVNPVTSFFGLVSVELFETDSLESANGLSNVVFINALSTSSFPAN